jgi:hypothetical protein
LGAVSPDRTPPRAPERVARWCFDGLDFDLNIHFDLGMVRQIITYFSHQSVARSGAE